MRWDQFRRSDNIEDTRGQGGLPGGAGGLGIGTIVVLGLIGWALGIDPRVLIQGAEDFSQGQNSQYEQQGPVRTGTPEDRVGQFVAAILGDTEDRWTDIFAREGRTYRAPKLRLFSGSAGSACGLARSAMGPFYCPRDQHVYLDTSFFTDLQTRFHGCSAKQCEFAEAYVIAHEVGHHVQNLLGILPKVTEAQRALDRPAANHLQVKVELQADCLAGIWAHHSDEKWNSVEPGDVEAALRTAAAIGDDRLQRQAQGYVVPDSFTHGSSAQRTRWLSNGLKSGELSSCDTFGAAQL
jgi:predicted metalloprotease